MNVKCKHCKALGFKSENKGTQREPHFGKLCCNKGQIMLAPIPSFPEPLMQLLNGTTDEDKHFQKNIRKFNSGMAMASLQMNNKTVTTGGPGAFKIQGLLHRRIGPMLAQEGQPPSFLQIYFLDSEEQATRRAQQFSDNASERQRQLDIAIFEKLRIILEECENSYLHSFQSVNEFVQTSDIDPTEVSIQLHATDRPTNNQHPGRYHLPTAPEISVLMPGEIRGNQSRSIVCSMRHQYSL